MSKGRNTRCYAGQNTHGAVRDQARAAFTFFCTHIYSNPLTWLSGNFFSTTWTGVPCILAIECYTSKKLWNMPALSLVIGP